MAALPRVGDEPLVDQFGVLPNAGASIGITRRLLESVGGFPDDLPRMYDIALSWEVQFAGTPLHYVPEAVYRVRYRDNLLDLFRQGFAGASSRAACSTSAIAGRDAEANGQADVEVVGAACRRLLEGADEG